MPKDHQAEKREKSTTTLNPLLLIIGVVYLLILPGIMCEICYLFFFSDSTESREIFDKTKRTFGLLNSENPRQSKLEIIGCGFSRCGSSSTKDALKDFGYNIYHGSDIMRYPDQHEFWINAFKDPQEGVDNLVTELLRNGYNGTSPGSLPTGLLCLELFERFPDAKVIYNVRDSLEQWIESFNALWKASAPFMTKNNFPLWLIYDPYEDLFAEIMKKIEVPYEFKRVNSVLPWANYVDDIVYDDSEMKNAFQKHLERVKKVVPPNQFLEFNVKYGWGPLVEFLGKEQEFGGNNEKFPYVNTRSVVVTNIVLVRIIGKYYPFLFLGIVIYIYTYVKIIQILFNIVKKKRKKLKGL